MISGSGDQALHQAPHSVGSLLEILSPSPFAVAGRRMKRWEGGEGRKKEWKRRKEGETVGREEHGSSTRFSLQLSIYRHALDVVFHRGHICV